MKRLGWDSGLIPTLIRLIRHSQITLDGSLDRSLKVILIDRALALILSIILSNLCILGHIMLLNIWSLALAHLISLVIFIHHFYFAILK